MPIGNKPRRKSWRIPLGRRGLQEFRMRAEVPGSPTHSTGGSVFWTICTSMAAAGIVKLSGPCGLAERGATQQVAWATEAAAAGRGPRETAATVQPPAWRRAGCTPRRAPRLIGPRPAYSVPRWLTR